jgi:hypothetical protein
VFLLLWNCLDNVCVSCLQKAKVEKAGEPTEDYSKVVSKYFEPKKVNICLVLKLNLSVSFSGIDQREQTYSATESTEWCSSAW